MDRVGDMRQALAHAVFSISCGPNSMMDDWLQRCRSLDHMEVSTNESHSTRKDVSVNHFRPHFTWISASWISTKKLEAMMVDE